MSGKHRLLPAIFLLAGGQLARAGEQGAPDFGLETEQRLARQTPALFGFAKPLETSAPVSHDALRLSDQAAGEQIRLASGLSAAYVTRQAGDPADQMVLWPSEADATHLLICVESNRQTLADGRLNPSVQRIELKTGRVDTLLRGLDGCDAIRRTAWGTLLVGEEKPDGGLYEILDPLQLTEAAVRERAAGRVGDPARVVKRTALPVLEWEGVVVLEDGILYAGDEQRPGTTRTDGHGGAIYKFIPARLWRGGTVGRLEDSPLTAGTVQALRVSCKVDRELHGQGCEVGNANWIPVRAEHAREDADRFGATGYYRPEDMARDPRFSGPGVRVCWSNTGDPEAGHHGEILCAEDSHPELGVGDAASAFPPTVMVRRFIVGDPEFDAFDNLDFQPGSGNLYVLEDRPNGDVYACLPDGRDRDLKSDGCVRLASLTDSSAEPSGLIFTADGRTAYLAVSHSRDGYMAFTDGFPSDDILKITGFKPLRR
ncbi:MAG TPA: alkaline phosphatase PhoX [Methylococcaceae bacterium]|nr:alkaline phosphatase PhoX [Methylococcaceae bacterium]